MNWFVVLIPTFLISFGTSFLINIFRDAMRQSGGSPEVMPVEVMNINDLVSRK